MDIAKLFAIQGDQEKGEWLELTHPVNGSPTGIRVKVAGPDSNIQKHARFEMNDAIQKAVNKAKRGNSISAAVQDEITARFLAQIVTDVEAMEDGKPVRLSLESMLRLINAGTWVRSQIDVFAASRAMYYAAPDESDTAVDVEKA